MLDYVGCNSAWSYEGCMGFCGRGMVKKGSVISSNVAHRLCEWGIHTFRMKAGAGFPWYRLFSSLWMFWAYCSGFFFPCFVKQKWSDWAPEHLNPRKPVCCFNHSYPEKSCSSPHYWSPVPEHWVSCLTCARADSCRMWKTSRGRSLISSVWILCLKCSDPCPSQLHKGQAQLLFHPWAKERRHQWLAFY